MKANDTITQIDRQTYCIEEDGGTVYGYLLCGARRAVLIDTGFGGLDYRSVAGQLTALPVFVINTHGHLDHISCNWQFETVYLHPADEAVYQEHCSYDVRRDFMTNLLREAAVPEEQWLLSPFKERIEKRCAIPMAAWRPLTDGERLELGGRELEVIHTPGHTPGSICVLDCATRRLFSGDTVCAQGILLNLKHCGSVETFARSIRRLSAQGDRYDSIWPAHHQKPIGKDYLHDYEMCAQKILESRPGGNEAALRVEAASWGRVQVVYTTDNVWDRTGCEP